MTGETEQALVGEAGGFRIVELRLPGGYRQPVVEPDAGYLALVAEGSVEKGFARGRLALGAGSVASIPAGAGHDARFGPEGTVVVVVRPSPESAASPPLRRLLGSARSRRACGVEQLARRIAAELRAGDAAAPLALEGLALGAVAAVLRGCEEPPSGSAPRWLAGVLEELETVSPPPSLAELAARAGVDPSHLARVFRRHRGTSVGEHVRRLRLERAARRLAEGEEPLAEVAVATGFSDQAHFTRAFGAYAGVTPGRYRALMRSSGAGDRMRAARARAAAR